MLVLSEERPCDYSYRVTLPLLWFLAPGVHPWVFYAGFVGAVYLGGDVLRFGLKERLKA